VVRPRRVVRFARLIHAARPRSWRTCGPRRLRRQSQPELAATHGDMVSTSLVSIEVQGRIAVPWRQYL
jgi:hypothetical protein